MDSWTNKPCLITSIPRCKNKIDLKTSATLANNIETLENQIEDLREEQSSTNRLVVTLAEEIAGLASTVANQ